MTKENKYNEYLHEYNDMFAKAVDKQPQATDIGLGANTQPAAAPALHEDLLKKVVDLDKRVIEMYENIGKDIENLYENIDRSVETSKKNSIPPVNKHSNPLPGFKVILNKDDLRALEQMLIDMETEEAMRKRANPGFTRDLNATGNIDKNYQQHKQPSLENTNFLTERDNFMSRTKEGWFTEPDGTQKHYKNGKLHRENGPAEVRLNGTQLYYRNGKLHRDGGQPAMIGAGGTTKYALNGKYHRLGGLPAITWSKSPYRQEWWENGEIKRALKKDGTQEWYAPGSTEREEAILHRTDGPALIHPNGKEEFWLDGNNYRSREEWEVALNRLNNMREAALDRELIDEDPIEADEFETKSSKKETTQMTKPSFTEILKQNAADAGYRVAATQSTNIVKNAILTVMRNKGADDGAIAGFSKFLDTEFGAALISFALGSGLHYVPHFGDDPRVQRLAEEMRVNGMATAGNAVIGEAMAHVLPALTEVLQKLPAVENSNNVRVEEARDSKLAEALEEETAEEEEVSSKTMHA